MSKTATTEIKIPRLMDFPEYANLQGKLDALKMKKTEIERQLADGQTTIPFDVFGRAKMLLAGDGAGGLAAVTARDGMEDLRRQQRVIHEAIRLCERELDKTGRECGERFCTSVQPAHKTLIKKMLASMVETSKLFMESDNLLGRDGAWGIFGGTYPLVANLGGGIGRLDDYNSVVCHVLREAIRDGYLAENDPLVLASKCLGGGEDFLLSVKAEKAKAEQREAKRKADELAERRKKKLSGRELAALASASSSMRIGMNEDVG